MKQIHLFIKLVSIWEKNVASGIASLNSINSLLIQVANLNLILVNTRNLHSSVIIKTINNDVKLHVDLAKKDTLSLMKQSH